MLVIESSFISYIIYIKISFANSLVCWSTSCFVYVDLDQSSFWEIAIGLAVEKLNNDIDACDIEQGVERAYKGYKFCALDPWFVILINRIFYISWRLLANDWSKNSKWGICFQNR